MLTILGRSSSINVRKVLCTCDELALNYVQQHWGAGFASTATPEFMALNPNALVPVMQEGDFVLWESNTICRYLANTHPQAGLLPVDPQQRAHVEKWMDWQLGDLNNAWRYVFMARLRNTPANPDPALLAASEKSWNHQMQILDQQVDKTAAWVTGEHFTLADIVLGLSLHRWLMTPMSRPALPALDAYYDRLRERPTFATYATQEWP